MWNCFSSRTGQGRQRVQSILSILVLTTAGLGSSHVGAFTVPNVPTTNPAVSQLPASQFSTFSHYRRPLATFKSQSSSSTLLKTLPFDEDGPVGEPIQDEFNVRTTVFLIGGQALLVLAAAGASLILGTPNYGLGNGFALTNDAIFAGAIATIPLFVLALVLDVVEKSVPALKDVTMATQRSVLAVLGGTFKPVAALGTAIGLGAAAGIGEEMLFRGVLQTELSNRFGDVFALGASSVVFGALHAVTPIYAFLAGLASVFFGYLYLESHNLAVPIVCHGLYDVGALLWAHWTITQMTEGDRDEIRKWISPVEK